MIFFWQVYREILLHHANLLLDSLFPRALFPESEKGQYREENYSVWKIRCDNYKLIYNTCNLCGFFFPQDEMSSRIQYAVLYLVFISAAYFLK